MNINFVRSLLYDVLNMQFLLPIKELQFFEKVVSSALWIKLNWLLDPCKSTLSHCCLWDMTDNG